MLFMTESECRRQKELLHFLQQLSDEPLQNLQRFSFRPRFQRI